MSYLADACALITFLLEPDAQRRMPRSFSVLREGNILVSPVTVWEVTRKVALGKLRSLWGESPSFVHLLESEGYRLHPFTWEDAEIANQLPWHHRDPMDRMLIATALRANLTIISSDSTFAPYGVKTIW